MQRYNAVGNDAAGGGGTVWDFPTSLNESTRVNMWTYGAEENLAAVMVVVVSADGNAAVDD